MKKKAVISIISSQKSREDDKIEVQTPGSYCLEEDYYLAQYDETELSGMEGTKTILHIYPDKLSLIREGTTNAKMEFIKNNKYTTLYNTPYGPLDLIIHTKDLQIDVDENGGEILVNYNMSLSGLVPEKTELKINIKTQ